MISFAPITSLLHLTEICHALQKQTIIAKTGLFIKRPCHKVQNCWKKNSHRITESCNVQASAHCYKRVQHLPRT